MKKTPTRPDLLERFDALGLTAAAFEKRHRLPRNLLPTMRQGRYSGVKASSTMDRLTEALEKEEAARGTPTPEPIAPTTASVEVEHEATSAELRAAILKAIENAYSEDELLAVQALVTEGAASGEIDRTTMRLADLHVGLQLGLVLRLQDPEARKVMLERAGG